MKTWVLAIFFALLVIVFHPLWSDYETARRGVLMVLVGTSLLGMMRRQSALPQRIPRGATWILLWLLLSTVSVTRAHNPGAAAFDLAYQTTLLVLLLVGAGPAVGSQTVLRAIMPAGILSAGLALMQRFGFLQIAESTEPVSSLGNMNVASEFFTMAAIGAAVSVLPGPGLEPAKTATGWRRAQWLCLFLAAAAVATNHSLSGRIALPAAGTLAVIGGIRNRAAWMPLLLVILCAIALPLTSFLWTASTPATVDGSNDPATDIARLGDTSKVRVLLWRGTLAMASDAPLFGHGTAQFEAVYPRYRPAQELEISTGGRRYAVTAESPHNDYLEVLAETGAIGALLLLLAAITLLARAHILALAILLAFALHAGVRSPTGNAPVAAFVFLFLGTLQPDRGRLSLRFFGLPLVQALLGATLLAMGTMLVVSQSCFVDYVRMRRLDPSPDAAEVTQRTERQSRSLAAALSWNPADARLQNLAAEQALRKAERLAARDATDLTLAEEQVRRAVRLWPFDPSARLRLARLLKAKGETIASLASVDALLELDPGNPEAALFAAATWTEQGRPEEALRRLYTNVHPRLRPKLNSTVQQLAEVARQRQLQGSDLLTIEALFLAALDTIESPQPLAPNRRVAAFADTYRRTDAIACAADMRPWLLYALRALFADDTDSVERCAARAKGTRLTDTHRRLIGENRLQALCRRSAAWAALLA